MSAALVPLLAVVSGASGQMVLFDTGPTRQVLFDATNQGNHALSFVGLGSGDLGTGLEQRWTAMPFTLPAGDWDITQIDANYFHSEGTPERVGIRIWSRTGQDAPTSAGEIFSGDVPAPTLVSDPRITGGGLWLGELDVAGLGINLSGGDYYLTLYGIDTVGNARISWMMNAENGIPLVDPATNEPFMWRSAQYPSPGFVASEFPTTLIAQQPGMDPHDRFNLAFTVHGIPSPGTLGLLALGGVLALRRRR